MSFSLFTLACATCINQDGQVTTIAANGAVFVMLAALALVFVSFATVVFSFIRRARRHAASQEGGVS